VNANPPSQGTPLWEELLLWFGPALLLGGLLAWWMRSGGAGALGGLGAMGMGKSKARRYAPGSAKQTTFADVAGIDDVKDEVMEIVDFLRYPDRYTRLGAKIPHGVLLSASPTLEEDEAYAAAGISPGTAPAAIAPAQAG
jgi:cell division protease FtsH